MQFRIFYSYSIYFNSPLKFGTLSQDPEDNFFYLDI